jgi:hypothetical protein
VKQQLQQAKGHRLSSSNVGGSDSAVKSLCGRIVQVLTDQLAVLSSAALLPAALAVHAAVMLWVLFRTSTAR